MWSLSWAQVNAWRLSQHTLLERAQPEQWPQVVRQIGGLHAQVMSAAELALWARVEGLPPDTVHNALWRDRTLVKTWAMRGTLHLMDVAEWPAVAAALNHSVSAFYRRPSWLKFHGVTLDELNALLEAARTTLTDSPMTRQQLAEAIAEQTGIDKLRELLRSGWGVLLKPAAHQGSICFGPNQGQNVTFVRPDLWLGVWREVDPEQALREVVKRYLGAYGPATVDDFGRWWGLDPSKARKLFKVLGDEIVEVDVEGWQAWALASTLEQMAAIEASPTVRLLPLFDPYTVSLYRHCQYVMPKTHKERVYRPQGWIGSVVLVDGRIEGVWDYERQRTKTVVTVEMFAPPAAGVQEGIEAEAKRLGLFWESEMELNTEKVT